ncbi:MAG TPA: class I SAM-dependent methyltransferase [Candidatus Binatia bacterium]|jgi:SAM-dependent methyltransferase
MSCDVEVAPAGGDEASFTGERFLPQCPGEIAYEHWHRYAFARAFAAGKAVLDVASGEGYGAAFLATVATHVHGVDIDPDTVRQASRKYAACANLRFVQASCTALPFPDRSFDVIVSFETIEHIDGESQVRMLGEFDRLLKPEGMLILSSPNKAEYSDAREARNEFHVQELYRDELASLLARHFEATRWFSQRIQCWSGIWSDSPATAPIEALSIDDASVRPYGSPQAMYYVVLASRTNAAFSVPLIHGSLLTDPEDSVAKRYETAVGQLIQQYKLVDDLTAARDRHAAHVLHLEQLVIERERIIENQALEAQKLSGAVTEANRALGDVRLEAQDARRDAEALKLQVAALQEGTASDRQTIDNLRDEVHRFTQLVRRMSGWRWWLRFPFRRARGHRTPEE